MYILKYAYVNLLLSFSKRTRSRNNVSLVGQKKGRPGEANLQLLPTDRRKRYLILQLPLSLREYLYLLALLV